MDYPNLVTPSGFISIGNTTVSYFAFHRQNLSYKIADGSEAGATITGMSSGNGVKKALYVFTATNAISAVSVQSYNGIGTIVDPSPQSVTSGSGSPQL